MIQEIQKYPVSLYSNVYILEHYNQEQKKKFLNMDELINDVCDALQITKSELYEGSRKARPKFGRWMVWKVMRTYKQYSFADCGKQFGSYDHTTVVHAMQNIDRDIADTECYPYLIEVFNKVKHHMRP
jgi:chromosomal replication initiation ATPase DnaA